MAPQKPRGHCKRVQVPGYLDASLPLYPVAYNSSSLSSSFKPSMLRLGLGNDGERNFNAKITVYISLAGRLIGKQLRQPIKRRYSQCWKVDGKIGKYTPAISRR
jgi:hypothetical protein